MDNRLIPINGLIALTRGDGGWPCQLRAQGFSRHQLEVPLSADLGEVRADAILYREDPNLVLLAECKSGRNVEDEQAKKYLAVDATWLRRAGVVPPALMSAADLRVCTIFVGVEEHRAALEHGLVALGIDAPLLTVGPTRVRLSGASGIAGLDDFDVHHTGGLPPARLPIDYQSADEPILEVLIPQITAAQARMADFVAIEDICSRILPEWAILSHGAQQSFVRRIAGLLRSLQTGDMRGQFRFEQVHSPTTRGRIVIVDSPARRDPRGRTRAWQANRDHAADGLKRPRTPTRPGQLSLDELADEGGLADE